MKTTASNIPGYRVQEYLLLLHLPEELCKKIIAVRKEFCAAGEVSVPAGGRPYVALVTFTQYEMMEERIINRLRMIAMGYPPFKVELKDFGSFPSHTIYINVTSKIPIQNLVKGIRSETRRLMKWNDDHKPHFILEPHLTLAAKLKPRQYEKGWQEYSHKHFTGRFIADAMLLLKRLPGEKKYLVAERFAFQHLPVTTRQGELFA